MRIFLNQIDIRRQTSQFRDMAQIASRAIEVGATWPAGDFEQSRRRVTRRRGFVFMALDHLELRFGRKTPSRSGRAFFPPFVARTYIRAGITGPIKMIRLYVLWSFEVKGWGSRNIDPAQSRLAGSTARVRAVIFWARSFPSPRRHPTLT